MPGRQAEVTKIDFSDLGDDMEEELIGEPQWE